jgi:hypothetical protein
VIDIDAKLLRPKMEIKNIDECKQDEYSSESEVEPVIVLPNVEVEEVAYKLCREKDSEHAA